MLKSKFNLVALAFAGATLSSSAAVLTAVPMQGGMVMPMISYHADHAHLHVMMDTNVPALTPLLASNPADCFDPADPWYDDLDPARRGLAFSRRYGFVMDSMTDLLPANTQIWLRKLSGSPELGIYRYATSTPKAWQPIFGTAGTTNSLYWNGMMFHPGVSAPAGTNGYTATFEAYLLNTTTGQEVPGSSSGPFVLNWTTVPDGRPSLSLARKLVVAWPTDATNYFLTAAATPDAATWTTITNVPVLLEGQSAVVLDATDGAQFFRMQRVP